MTYLQYWLEAEKPMPPLDRMRLALQYYAEVKNHPQRLAFDKGDVARDALQRVANENTAAISQGDVAQ